MRAAARLALKFRDDTSGNVAVIFALMGVVLMLAIGAAVDVGRWLHARDQTMAAIDAAVLAGGRALQTSSGDESAAIAAAKKYYDENVTSRLPVINDTVNFTVAQNGMGMTANGSAYIKTPFLQFAAVDKLPLISTSQTEFSKSEIVIGGKGSDDTIIEIALMLDVTGSMDGSPRRSTQGRFDRPEPKTAAVTKIATRSSASSSTSSARKDNVEGFRRPLLRGHPASFGLAQRGAWHLGSGDLKTTSAPAATRPLITCTPCVVESARATTSTRSAGTGDANPLRDGALWYARRTARSRRQGELMPLTNDKTALLNKIENLTAAGGTAGHLGTAWAWYTLSPNWNTLWPAANRAAAHGTAGLKKIAILMTDGEYNTEYDKDGVKTGSPAPARGKRRVDRASRKLCEAMKAGDKITVYTVGFDVGINSTAEEHADRTVPRSRTSTTTPKTRRSLCRLSRTSP